jgi:subtilisin family serine protease
MAAAQEPSRQPATKTDAQVALIVQAFADADPPIEIGVARFREGNKQGEVNYLYEKGTILVRTVDAETVGELLRRHGRRGYRETRLPGAISGLVRFSLRGTDFEDVLDALEQIDAEHGVGVATPNHVLSITPVTGCPATEPEEVDPDADPDPPVCPADRDGATVLMHVLDTGLVDHAAQDHTWLTGVTGDIDPVSAGTIGAYTGHGTFIAGVARCMAPATEVFVRAAFIRSGATLELDFVKEVEAALTSGVDVISLSAGTSSRNDVPLLAFEAFWKWRLRNHKGVVLVAAAGNNSDRRPFWPAAFEEVVSVGALAANWRSRASFSNFGGWVDVYAPGEALVNAFATGDFTCNEPPHRGEVRHFDGMARWSGTSFSTPLVAGLIAARMSRTSENGRLAAKALLAKARAHRLAGVGPVLLPCLDDNADDCHCRSHAKCRCGCGDGEHRHP